jgi:hypothetical protein
MKRMVLLLTAVAVIAAMIAAAVPAMAQIDTESDILDIAGSVAEEPVDAETLKYFQPKLLLTSTE